MKLVISLLLILNLVGFCLANSSICLCNAKTDATSEIIGHAENQWSVNANVSEGDIIKLNLIPGATWTNGVFDVDDDKYPGWGLLYAAINFTVQNGDDTVFVITLGINLNLTGFLFLLEINVTANNGALDPSPFYKSSSNSYSEIGGIVQSRGNCTTQTHDIWPKRTDPPIQLVLMRVWSGSVDLRPDRTIDIFDIVVAAIAFNSTVGQSRWNPKADINGDGVIDRFDLDIIAGHFGEEFP